VKIPKNVLIIGQVCAITYRPTKARRATSVDFEAQGKEIMIATNKTHSQLFMFENVQTGKVEAVTDKSGHVKGFVHQLIEFKIPQLTLKKIGSIVSIRYKTVWWEGLLREYRHDFGTNEMYADKYSRFTTIGITTKKGKILNKDGITG